MAYTACPNCKYIQIIWKDSDTLFTNLQVMQKEHYGLACPLCFAEMKIIPGDAPESCHHGISKNAACRECLKSNSELRRLEQERRMIDDKIKGIR